MPRPRRPSSSAQPSEIQRLLVLVEAMQGDIRRIAEGYGTLQHEMEQLRQELVSRINELERQMKLGFRELGQELAQVKQAVSEIDRRLQTHEHQAHAT